MKKFFVNSLRLMKRRYIISAIFIICILTFIPYMPINMGLNYAGVCTNPLHFGILSDNELKEIAFKQYLQQHNKEYNYKHNIPFFRIQPCNGDKRPDDNCEFWKIPKELNLENLLSIGRQICKDGKQIAPIDKSILKAIDDESVVYPWEDSKLFNDKGELNYSIYFNNEDNHYSEYYRYDSLFIAEDPTIKIKLLDLLTGKSKKIIYKNDNRLALRMLLALKRIDKSDDFCTLNDWMDKNKLDVTKESVEIIGDKGNKIILENYSMYRIGIDNCGNYKGLYMGILWEPYKAYMNYADFKNKFKQNKE